MHRLSTIFRRMFYEKWHIISNVQLTLNVSNLRVLEAKILSPRETNNFAFLAMSYFKTRRMNVRVYY